MEVSTQWKGLTVKASVDKGWEGDPSIPNGTRVLWSIEDLEITSSEGDDLYDYLTDAAINEIENLLIEKAYNGY